MLDHKYNIQSYQLIEKINIDERWKWKNKLTCSGLLPRHELIRSFLLGEAMCAVTQNREQIFPWTREQSTIHMLYDVYVPYKLKILKLTESSVKHKMTIKLNCPDIKRVILYIREFYVFLFSQAVACSSIDPIGIFKKLQKPNNIFPLHFLLAFEWGALNLISCVHCSW